VAFLFFEGHKILPRLPVAKILLNKHEEMTKDVRNLFGGSGKVSKKATMKSNNAQRSLMGIMDRD
jgi:hypothetical protein